MSCGKWPPLSAVCASRQPAVLDASAPEVASQRRPARAVTRARTYRIDGVDRRPSAFDDEVELKSSTSEPQADFCGLPVQPAFAPSFSIR